jgi:hypothetical protein
MRIRDRGPERPDQGRYERPAAAAATGYPNTHNPQSTKHAFKIGDDLSMSVAQGEEGDLGRGAVWWECRTLDL